MTNDDDLRARLSIWWTSCSDSINKERADALVVIEKLTKERDSARRMVCYQEWMRKPGTSARNCAEDRGWDCFDSVPADIEAHEIRGDLSGGNS